MFSHWNSLLKNAASDDTIVAWTRSVGNVVAPLTSRSTG